MPPVEKQEDKFEQVDLPKILAALHKARAAKLSGRVTVDFADNGGVLTIQLELKQRFK